MRDLLKFVLPLGSAAALLAVSSPVLAACCKVPSTHQVRIPSVIIGRPQTQPAEGCKTNCGCGSECAPPTCKENCGGGGKRPPKGGFGGSFNFEVEVIAEANAQAQAAANAQARSRAFADSVAFGLGGAINGSSGFGGGGGGGPYIATSSTYLPSLNVEGEAAAEAAAEAYEATRTVLKTMVVQAVCIDAKLVPHPASQVRPDKDVQESYEGELYRCLAGTQLQYTLSEYAGAAVAGSGKSVLCAKGEALYHAAGGRLECRAQKAARDCNERSLLRRYGTGLKVIRLAMTETYTAYRSSAAASASASVTATAGIQLDGGVGGIIY